eukprot:TRINITY_DN5030_c0_g1_i1.p1 TRINITY_DN5030_c0_g1~~TRINITY_DN5030_c0_g1_i1.p1  ORF type:complete len:311 (+),score=53.95 TRINITY_DN5030_c0_g1_i1:57-989(+)
MEDHTPKLVLKINFDTDNKKSTLGKRRKRVSIHFEQPDGPEQQGKNATHNQDHNKADDDTNHDHTLPPRFEEVWALILKMREKRDAPVDTVGCEALSDPSQLPSIFRFGVLVSLMLSSQTKDTITSGAMGRLRSNLESADNQKGLTPQNILATDEKKLDSLITPVGFHNRKAKYLKLTSKILLDKYDGDIPPTYEDLLKLPGVGPKMAQLTMQCAWGVTVGIGVDVHVHRITQRLGWVNHDKKNPTPEDTRRALEKWLPKEYWRPINALLVGFGQTVCVPVGPKCKICLLNKICPSSRVVNLPPLHQEAF